MSGGIGGGTDEGFDLSTKGQIHGFSTTDAAISLSGNDDYVLVEDSSNSLGVAWKENAHSSVTPSSTTTFTNKSIAFSGNTVTATLAELDTALSTTGTASATTYLRGDNSWSTIASGGQVSLLETVTLGSANANVAKASMSYSTDDYAYFIIAFSGKAVTNEAAALEFRINDLSANYGYTVTENYNGTLSGTAGSITTEIPLMSTTVHTGNTQAMNVIVTIQSSTVGYRYYNIVSDCWIASNTNDTNHVIGGQAGTPSTTFSKFDFFLSTGNNFDTDSSAVLYGVLR